MLGKTISIDVSSLRRDVVKIEAILNEERAKYRNLDWHDPVHASFDRLFMQLFACEKSIHAEFNHIVGVKNNLEMVKNAKAYGDDLLALKIELKAVII